MKRQDTKTELRTCINILAMTEVKNRAITSSFFPLFSLANSDLAMLSMYVTGFACRSAFLYRGHQCC